MNFGELIKQLRITKQLTLRQCCSDLGVDPSNWSKMERGVTPPPKDISLLERWAKFFGVVRDKQQEFFDLAAIARSELPADVASDDRVLAALPAFFRAVRGSELDGDKLKEFIEDIRALHSPDQKSKG
ncbi:MAG: helix-turn-helix transcriptional regulator [Verrucomicrobia bacterium]|nr:helix-turn-helix transcriptional regulator [Verrucomicrobiota bacterium]